MKKLIYSLFIFIIPTFLIADSKPKEIVQNVIDKQEQIVSLIETYLTNGDNVDLKSIGNKYNVDRELLSKYFNIESSFFTNLSNEKCIISSDDFCSNDNGLEFELVEQNNYYTGVRFKDINVFGTKCIYCNNIFFKNFYKNIITGTRIKILETHNDTDPTNDSVFYPFSRSITDLFVKTDNFYQLYGETLHIGSKAPIDNKKVWVDIRGSKSIERYWFESSKKWLEKETDNNITYLKTKSALKSLPLIDGTKAIVLSEDGFSTTYSYNSAYATPDICQKTNKTAPLYDEYCGWLKVIKGMDDFDFRINGIDLSNKGN